MTCIYCHTPMVKGYVCDSCAALGAKRIAANEDAARTIKCPSCKARVGEPCLTGSGIERSHHEVRLSRARRHA